MTSAARIIGVFVLCLLTWQFAGTVSAQTDASTPPLPPLRFQILLMDGYSFEVDEVWKQGEEIWFRKGGISKSLAASSVKKFGPLATKTPPAKSPVIDSAAKPATPPAPLAIWIYLNGG